MIVTYDIVAAFTTWQYRRVILHNNIVVLQRRDSETDQLQCTEYLKLYELTYVQTLSG